MIICLKCTFQSARIIWVDDKDVNTHIVVVHGPTLEEIREACGNGAVGNEVAPDQKPCF